MQIILTALIVVLSVAVTASPAAAQAGAAAPAPQGGSAPQAAAPADAVSAVPSAPWRRPRKRREPPEALRHMHEAPAGGRGFVH